MPCVKGCCKSTSHCWCTVSYKVGNSVPVLVIWFLTSWISLVTCKEDIFILVIVFSCLTKTSDSIRCKESKRQAKFAIFIKKGIPFHFCLVGTTLLQFQTCKDIVLTTSKPFGHSYRVVIFLFGPVKVGKEVIRRNLVSLFFHELVIVFTQTIFMITTIFIGHGIIPRIFDWMIDLSCIFLGIEHEVAHFLTKRRYDISCCFLIDKISIKSIVFSQINQLTSDRESSVFVLFKGFGKFFLVCNTIRPVEEECTQYRDTITVTSINHVRSWNEPFPEDH